MAQGPRIDWGAFSEAAVEGRLLDLLLKMPRARWAERDDQGYALLHYACRGPNAAAVVAMIQSGLADVNVRDQWGRTSAHLAASWGQSCVLEVLCAAGADLEARDSITGSFPIDHALFNFYKHGSESPRVLVANGLRLRTVRDESRHLITPELEAFERGVLRCRSAAAALLSVKRVGNLWRWDKFLLRELAYAMWATRMSKQ